MRVLNVNSSLDFKTGGGMAERTFQMSRFLTKANVQCTVLTIDTGHDVLRAAALAPAKVFAMRLLWRRFYIPHINWKTVKTLVNDADLIHLMGHWSLLNALVYIAARRAGKPYVVCPAGSLPRFGRSAAIKRIYNLLIGNAIVRNASAWIAVTPGEFPHFESYGIASSRVTVISNGICAEDLAVADVEAFRRAKGLSHTAVILFMGRLNLIKGPDLLLQAFALIQNRIREYHLVFAGPDEGMQSGLAELAQRKGIADRVHFLGFVGGEDKFAAYRLAKLLVVPSRQEAMSIVALEAAVCGTPVMMTDQCGFGEIKMVDPRLEVPATAAGIADGLVQLIMEPGLLERVGPAFEDFVSRRYTWNVIVSEYLDLYKAILANPAKI
jgi:glycosyltransferase involved in cell wall biosynthesis